MKKILFVDDSQSIREAVSFALEGAGFDVKKAADGNDALKVFESNDFDLLLTDFHMPEMNGLELIKRVRKQEKYKHLPILVLTTETQRDVVQDAKQAGATGWLVKPFNMEKLVTTIRRVVR